MNNIYENIKNEKLLFMIKRIQGEYDNSKEEKFKILPDKLYRYEKISDQRVRTLEKNEIYMNNSEYFNDPFDCRGVFWDIRKIHEYCSENIKDFSYTIEELRIFIASMIDYALSPIKITCFSENKYNLPLWGNYADNRRGMCVEYDFKKLGIQSKFVEDLYPVFYEEKKVDITFALKSSIRCAITGEYHPVLPILFYKNLIKHSSWEYENEWRLVSIKENNIIKAPIKPTTIYIGDKCTQENIKKIKEVANKLKCGVIQLKAANFDNNNFIFEELLV